MQPHIGVEINLEYGCNGTSYQNILIVENGKVKSIGSFIYRLWRELANHPDTEMLLTQLAIEAEDFRTGKRRTEPSICYRENILSVLHL